MSPEQLEGKEADVRSDIWALGCVLYEMATGKRAFEGRSQASLIAAILERQPAAISESPSGSGATSVVGGPPAGLDRLIRNCLAKDPEERSQTAHDVKLQLQGIAENAGISSGSTTPSISGVPMTARAAGSSRPAWSVAGVALLVALAAIGTSFIRRPAAPPVYRFRVADIPGATEIYWPRVSPDGRYLLMQMNDSSGTRRAFVRRMDQVVAVPIPGTDGLRRAYWSPDSREVIFVLDEKLQRAPLAGGTPTVICAAQGGIDLSWGAKGQILMDGRFTDSLRVVPATGGDPKPAARVYRDVGEVGSAWPSFLPDGEHFLFLGNLRAGTGAANIRLGKLGSLDSKLLGRSDGRAEYAPGGWVLFVRGTSLLAQKLDLGAGKLTGDPITISDQIKIGSSAGHFSASSNGVIAFARGNGNEALTLREMNRSGAFTGPALVNGAIINPRLSPDGRRVLYQRSAPSNPDIGEIYVYDIERATDTRLTFTDNRATTPVWSPDGRRFAYAARSTSGAPRLHLAGADGMGAPDSIAVGPAAGLSLSQWAEAGSRLVYFDDDFVTRAVPAEGANRASVSLADSSQTPGQGQVSPDGKWLAFTGGSPPNLHVYVQSLLGPSGRWQITSKIQGFEPRWTKGGKELLYQGWDNRLMAVDIDTKIGFRPGTPRPLFTLPVPSSGPSLSSWACDAAGERFFVLAPNAAQNAGTIEVVTDFASLVNRK
jgi:Tol biopolymer transport system component